MGKKRGNREINAPAPTLESEVASSDLVEIPEAATVEVIPEPMAEVPLALSIPLPHEASAERCSLANHHDGHGHCIRCLHCKVKVRPQHMGQACPARNGE